jgi:hypothetical protein
MNALLRAIGEGGRGKTERERDEEIERDSRRFLDVADWRWRRREASNELRKVHLGYSSSLQSFHCFRYTPYGAAVFDQTSSSILVYQNTISRYQPSTSQQVCFFVFSARNLKVVTVPRYLRVFSRASTCSAPAALAVHRMQERESRRWQSHTISTASCPANALGKSPKRSLNLLTSFRTQAT